MSVTYKELSAKATALYSVLCDLGPFEDAKDVVAPLQQACEAATRLLAQFDATQTALRSILLSIVDVKETRGSVEDPEMRTLIDESIAECQKILANPVFFEERPLHLLKDALAEAKLMRKDLDAAYASDATRRVFKSVINAVDACLNGDRTSYLFDLETGKLVPENEKEVQGGAGAGAGAGEMMPADV